MSRYMGANFLAHCLRTMDAVIVLAVALVKTDHVRQFTLEELLACVFTEEGVMLDRAREVVDHELEDRLNILLGVTSVRGEGRILLISVKAMMMNENKHTHSPRSRTRRARYMAAAATWLGGYWMKRWSRHPISSRYLPRVRV